MRESQNEAGTTWTLLFICWFLACLATLGSLFFSEVMKYAPCVLCWYQRICMYPLVIILLRGLFPWDGTVLKYSIPLALIGLGISIYHNLLYYHILPESVAPCQQGISCTTVYINWMGLITIPLLSLTAFALILALLFAISSMQGKIGRKNEE